MKRSILIAFIILAAVVGWVGSGQFTNNVVAQDDNTGTSKETKTSYSQETKNNGNYSLSGACNILINNQDLGGVNIDDSVWLDIDTPEALDYIKKNRKLFKE